MTNTIDLEKVFFLDIETVSAVEHYSKLDETVQKLWTQKMLYQAEREEKTPEELYDKAAIFAEFGKIICISCGFITQRSGEPVLRIKSFYGDDEKKLLQDFTNTLDAFFKSDQYMLCAHNGKEFDFPYICRRMLIHGLQLPAALNIQGKKPWEIKHLDTLELWKFGDYKHFTSLALLTHIFGIPTPKDDISGADVSRVYWQEKDLDRIVIYCQKDVTALAQLMLRFQRKPLLGEHQIVVTA
jgi:uncharacterized protein YprB with RNaseH-like and TPR domain